jgi:hypothetical protein
MRLILVVVLASAGLLAACGESEEEKAQNAVCDARAEGGGPLPFREAHGPIDYD